MLAAFLMNFISAIAIDTLWWLPGYDIINYRLIKTQSLNKVGSPDQCKQYADEGQKVKLLDNGKDL